MTFRSIKALFVLTALVSVLVNAGNNQVTDSVEHSQRLKSDKARDQSRQPETVLKFFEVKSGQRILDVFSGGGYYAELLSRAVGVEGSVVAHNNLAYLPYAKKDLALRQYESRLSNVEVVIAEADGLKLELNSFDQIFFVLGFHDMYYKEEGWNEIDQNAFMKLLHSALKPGGSIAIIDHQAKAGSGSISAQKLHRIDKNFVIAEMEKAGFTWNSELLVLSNKEDDPNKSVFDAEILGKSSRFVLKFTK